MLKSRSFWIYILLSFFILASAVYFHAFVYLYLISPLAQFFWAIYRLFASIHQRFYWFLLVGLIALLAYRIIFSVFKEPEDRYAVELGKPKRREQFWLKTISNAIHKGGDSRELLRRQFRQLFLSASNLSERTKPKDADTSLLNVQPPLPKELLSLFSESGDDHQKGFSSVDLTIARFVFPLMWWKKRRMRKITYQEIDEILQSMEDYLEIDYENEPNR